MSYGLASFKFFKHLALSDIAIRLIDQPTPPDKEAIRRLYVIAFRYNTI